MTYPFRILLSFIMLQIVSFAGILHSQIEMIDSLDHPGNANVQEFQLDWDYYRGFDKNLDSLYNLWYVNQAEALRYTQNDHSFPQDSNWTSSLALPADSILIARLDSIESIIDLPYNSIVRSFIDVYTVQKREKVAIMLGLSDYYFPMFEEILMEKSLPTELKYLAVIESALNPRAVSKAGATGLWQFMYATGRQYKLEINSEVDERKDPIKSTYAAAMFLQDLYLMFDDWTLALAAYNCGPGNVRKAIARAGGKRNFWDIYYHLPRETRGYVPAFIAASYAFNYYQEHNYHPVKLDIPLTTDTILVSKEIHLTQISEVLFIPIDLLRDLNPHYQRDIVPAKKKQYVLRLPHQEVVNFIVLHDSIYQHNRDYLFDPSRRNQAPSKTGSYGAPPKNSVKLVYVVKAGDNLGVISQKYNVSINDLRAWNNIRNNLIRIGQKLTVYVPESRANEFGAQPKTSSTKDEGEYVEVKEADYQKFEIYTVRSGDNLWDIAKKYPNVSFEDIKQLNGLTDKSKINPGQKLRIYQK